MFEKRDYIYQCGSGHGTTFGYGDCCGTCYASGEGSGCKEGEGAGFGHGDGGGEGNGEGEGLGV